MRAGREAWMLIEQGMGIFSRGAKITGGADDEGLLSRVKLKT